MRAGELRHQITIQHKTVTRGGMGGEVITWSDVGTVWAAVEPISGREYFAAKTENAEVSHRIRIRHRNGITSGMRVSWGARVFDIQAVLDIQERGREIHLMCVEVI